MSVRKSVMAIALLIAAIGTIQLESAAAQSFYEKITAVARTKVEPKPRPRSAHNPAIASERSGSANASHLGNPPPAISKVKQNSANANNSGKATDQNRWSNADIQIARARCQHILRGIKAEFVAMEPIKRGACGDPAPLKLKSIGSKPRVKFNPPAVVNCDMVVSLHKWIVNDLQPLARRHLKSPIVGVETMSSYSCRNAYGRKDTRLSQHARANAVDIRGFVTAKSARARLLAHWGPTQRAIRAAKRAKERAEEKKRLAKAAAEKAVIAAAKAKDKAAKKAAKDTASATSAVTAEAATPAELEASMPQVRPSILEGLSALMAGNTDPQKNTRTPASGFSLAPSKLGGPALASAAAANPAEEFEQAPSWPVYLVSKNANPAKARTPRARFLREAHRTACGLFGTVLGPEANNAHRNHFHVDMAKRKLGAYCR